MRRFRTLLKAVPVLLLLVGMGGIVEASWPSWECQGEPNPVYPDWHYNDESKQFDHCWGRADVKGDHESADFRCVCHREACNPDPGWWGYAQCDYYGPLWYWYAHNDASFWVSSGGSYWLDGELSVWIYTD